MAENGEQEPKLVGRRTDDGNFYEVGADVGGAFISLGAVPLAEFDQRVKEAGERAQAEEAAQPQQAEQG